MNRRPEPPASLRWAPILLVIAMVIALAFWAWRDASYWPLIVIGMIAVIVFKFRDAFTKRGWQ